MPLLDHFNPPLNRLLRWRSFHAAWAAAMARLLNQGILPPGYYALPLADRDEESEFDPDDGVEVEVLAEDVRPRP